MPKSSTRQNGGNVGVTRCFLVRAQAITEPPQADVISKPKAHGGVKSAQVERAVVLLPLGRLRTHRAGIPTLR